MMSEFGNILAEPDSTVSGEVVIGIIGAIFTGLGVLAGKLLEKRKVSGEVRLEEPVPTVPFRKVPGVVTYHQFEALGHRVKRVEEDVEGIEKDLQVLRKENAKQASQMMEAGAERETRIREALGSKIDMAARETHARIDDLFKELRKGGKA